MNVPVEIIVAFIVAMFGLQSWTLLTVVGLKAKVAEFSTAKEHADLKQKVAVLEQKLIDCPQCK
jgi:hypothetical protein